MPDKPGALVSQAQGQQGQKSPTESYIVYTSHLESDWGKYGMPTSGPHMRLLTHMCIHVFMHNTPKNT